MPWMLKARPRKTVADFMRLPEGTLAELIDGEIYVMSPSPETLHQVVVLNVTVALREHVRRKHAGQVFVAPLDVHLPSRDVVEPDVIFVSEARKEIARGRWIKGAPDLLVEVLSPSHPERDLIVKRHLYAQNGIREYWVVDPEAAAVEVLSLARTRYRPAGWFRRGATLRSRILPELRLPVRRIFEQS